MQKPPSTPRDAAAPPAPPAPITPSPGLRLQPQGTAASKVHGASAPLLGASSALNVEHPAAVGSGSASLGRTQQAHASGSGDAELSQPCPQASLLRAPDPQITDKDAAKARDATIVAIGVVAVLIVNVAYVGYITPPGGPDIWWLDCEYPMFIAYTCLNGFALVFAVADICAVAFGPLLLIWRRNPSWRQQVVKVGLFHLALSLASLLAAFAAAGFIAAGVGLPDAYCANVLCSEGGVRCSAFAYTNTTFLIRRNDGRVAGAVPQWDRTLPPVIVKLNNDTFSTGGESEVVCQDYRYIANFAHIAELYPDRILGGSIEDTSHGGVDNPCFVLLSEAVFGIPTSDNTYLVPVLGIKAPNANPYAMWCTRDSIPTGLGWLPLKLQRAADLLGVTLDALVSHAAIDSSGYMLNASVPCPDFKSFVDLAHAHLNNDSVPAFQLLRDVVNPMHNSSSESTYPTFLDNSIEPKLDATLQSAVCKYAVMLGWDANGPLSCPDTSLGIRSAGSPSDTLWPLGRAKYYPSLRYQCSGIVDGSLCDYGGYPQSHRAYAVDEDGNFLKRKRSDAKTGLYVHLSTNPATTKIYLAVISMIVVAGGAVSSTLLLLGCLPCAGLSSLLQHIRRLFI